MVDRERRHFLSTQHACAMAGCHGIAACSPRGVRLRANRLPVEGLAALAAFTATFTVSLLVWGPAYRAAVALSALFVLLGPSINHTCVVHTGRLALSLA